LINFIIKKEYKNEMIFKIILQETTIECITYWFESKVYGNKLKYVLRDIEHNYNPLLYCEVMRIHKALTIPFFFPISMLDLEHKFPIG
jgi:hypothetical protein